MGVVVVVVVVWVTSMRHLGVQVNHLYTLCECIYIQLCIYIHYCILYTAI